MLFHQGSPVLCCELTEEAAGQQIPRRLDGRMQSGVLVDVVIGGGRAIHLAGRGERV